MLAWILSRSPLAALAADHPTPEETALREARALLRLEPSAAVAHQRLGDALLRLRQPLEALQEFRQALALDPDLDVHHHLGLALYQLEQYDDAVLELSVSLKKSSNNSDLHND